MREEESAFHVRMVQSSRRRDRLDSTRSFTSTSGAGRHRQTRPGFPTWHSSRSSSSRMGRTTSKINKKIEDLLSSNTLPRCAASKMKKIRKIVKKGGSSAADGSKSMPTSAAPAELAEMTDDVGSLANFSERNLGDDSGYFENAGSICDVVMDDASVVQSLDESIQTEYDPKKPELLPLRPLYFEVPSSDAIHHRDQVFDTLKSQLRNQRGAVITGIAGAGKTSIMLDMVQNSHFGKSAASSNSSIDPFYYSIVGYHFMHCQDPSTLDLARLLHSLAAQLTQHPALAAYREFLVQRPDLTAMLSRQALRENPGRSLVKAILDPLRNLYRNDRIGLDKAVILIDGLDEEEAKDGAHITPIAEFLAKNILRFPSWLKLVVTHRSDKTELTQLMHLPYINLNLGEEDIIDYIEGRIFNSPNILANIISKDQRRKNKMIVKLVSFVVQHAEGSFLYAKLILDLLYQGIITIKSEALSSVPQSIEEVFHLYLSFKFKTSASFQTVSQIFSICLASTRPLSLAQVYRVLEYTDRFTKLQEEYDKVSALLVTRSDGSLMFTHRDFSMWLVEDYHQFHCSLIPAHNQFIRYFATAHICRTNEALDFVHHLAKCDFFNQPCEYFSNVNRKFLYLTYKVDRNILKKVKKAMYFSSFVEADSVSLINMAIESNA